MSETDAPERQGAPPRDLSRQQSGDRLEGGQMPVLPTHRAPQGAAPGTLVAHPQAEKTVLNLALIAPGRHEFLEDVSLDAVREKKDEWPLVWVDCVGLADVKLVEDLGHLFGIHPLALEDAVTEQRPKADFYESSVFVILRMIDEPEARRHEQISVGFGEKFVVTFQERSGDPFDPVRRRIKGNSPLCGRKGDYLAYALIDAIVDSYFPVVDGIAGTVDRTEDAVFDAASAGDRRILELHRQRRNVVSVKRTLWPLKDALAGLQRTESPLVQTETKLYLADTLDHVVRLIEMLESDRDTLTGLIEIDLALAQARTNDVINLLTIVSTIFIPLTFLVGVWGMNFDPKASPWNMPELEAYYGYPGALLFMALIALGLIVYFRKKKWLRTKR